MQEDKFLKLGLAMAEILNGKKKAIEDLKILLDKHPEMVDKVKEVAKSIEAIANKIDTNIITEYGIKIVMDEEKILREGKYTLEEIYKNIDYLAEFSRMKKIDKFYYVSKNDTPSDLGCFVWSNLEEQDWFIENVKEWLWLDKEEGIDNILEVSKEFKGLTKQPKTKSSFRVIDMLPQCEFFLREQRKITGLSKYIFLKSNGKIYNNSGDLLYEWYKLLEKLNLEKRNIYQTRHSFASNMLSNKENLLWVSQMLGHKTLNMTLEIYTKYIKEENAPRKTTFLDKNIFRFAQN